MTTKQKNNFFPINGEKFWEKRKKWSKSVLGYYKTKKKKEKKVAWTTKPLL